LRILRPGRLLVVSIGLHALNWTGTSDA